MKFMRRQRIMRSLGYKPPGRAFKHKISGLKGD
jgi:hypothetical protein